MIKIEHPTGGDFLRTIPPFDDGVSLFWAVEGRGKRSVTLDLSNPKGQEILRRLVPHADVLVENFQPGTLERWRLSPDGLRALNPRLIVSRVSVYGQDGPYRDRPGLDRNAIALGGLLHITGHPDHPPVRPGVVIGDYLSALFNTVGILAALVERGRSGQGQGVEVALYESVLRVMEWTVAAYDRLGVVRERTGNRLPNSAPLDNYETADGRFVCIVAAGDVLFPRLCEAMGRTDLPADERFASLERRAANADAINGIVATWCRDRTAEDIEADRRDRGRPACSSPGLHRHRGRPPARCDPTAGPGSAARPDSPPRPGRRADARTAHRGGPAGTSRDGRRRH